jgi:hypothetical protein
MRASWFATSFLLVSSFVVQLKSMSQTDESREPLLTKLNSLLLEPL